MPFQQLPAKLIQDIRKLSFVNSVPYSGYSVNEEETEESKSSGQSQQPQYDDDGNLITPPPSSTAKKEGEKIRTMNMSLAINVKGTEVNFEEEEG
jgi:hypothetical protein